MTTQSLQLVLFALFTAHVYVLYQWMKNQGAWQKRQDQEIMKIYGHLKAQAISQSDLAMVVDRAIQIQREMNQDLRVH